MGSIADILKALVQLIPLLLDLIKLFKGQSTEVQKGAVSAAREAAKNHCDLSAGVGCSSEIKK